MHASYFCVSVCRGTSVKCNDGSMHSCNYGKKWTCLASECDVKCWLAILKIPWIPAVSNVIYSVGPELMFLGAVQADMFLTNLVLCYPSGAPDRCQIVMKIKWKGRLPGSAFQAKWEQKDIVQPSSWEWDCCVFSMLFVLVQWQLFPVIDVIW